jgi:hypothetical protein
MYQSAYDRILAANLRDYEREIARTVERKFTRMLEAIQAGEEVEIPVIDEELAPPEYRTPEYYDELQATAVRACVCRKWFEYESPRWAWPLPLTREDCLARCNTPEARPHSRAHLVGQYGLLLREFRWHYERAKPFEVFCADRLRPPGFW